MYINSIDNAYYVAQLKAAGYLRSLDPVEPIEKISFKPSENLKINKIDSDKDKESDQFSSINPQLNPEQPLSKLFESFQPSLDLAAQQKIFDANSIKGNEDPTNNVVDNNNEISAERKGFILHLPEDHYRNIVQNNQKNVLVNDQVRLKEFYTAANRKQGVLVNLAI
ncbi:MAG: hypothetical protein JEY94_13265 [Melioribacteraceae bacterium]|nr:hypothetical protein [Melioribacteraceae bacterium]